MTHFKLIANPAENGKKRNKGIQGFDVGKIHINLLEVQSQFNAINQQLYCQRDFLHTATINNLIHAYDLINDRLKKNPKKHIIPAHVMLELNAIVHLGIKQHNRLEFNGFLNDTNDKFSKYIGTLMKWYERHYARHDDPYTIAAGLYVRILASPQLFIEGNHRTGALVANYHLLLSGEMPFILTVENAIEFFNLASDVKFPKKDIHSKFKRFTGWGDEKDRMSQFLRANVRPFTQAL